MSIEAIFLKPKHSFTPLLPVALAVITGILLARYRVLNPLSPGIISAAVMVVSGILLFRTRSRGKNQKINHLIWFLICLGFAAVAALRYYQIHDYFPQDHIIWYCSDQQRLATLRGTIVTEPYIVKSTGRFADFDALHQPRTIFTLRCTEVLSQQGWIDADGLVYVVVSQPAPHLRLGRHTQIDCWIKLRAGPHNPGVFNRLDQYHAARTLAACYVNYPEAISIISQTEDTTTLISRARRKLQNFAYASVIDDTYQEAKDNSKINDSEAFLMALLLGQRYRLNSTLNEYFARTGTLHYLSLSGFHVGLWAGFIWGLGWLLRLPRWWRGLLTIIALILFILIVPPRAPILRAGVISIIFSLAYMTRRTPDNLNLLCFAAALILLWRPLDLFAPGFQLSFIVVLGIIIFAQALQNRKLFSLQGQLDIISRPLARGLNWDGIPWWQYQYFQTKKYVLALFAVALLAWLVGMPLIAWHFNRFTPYAIFGSVCLFPLISLTLFLGFTKLLLSGLFPLIGWLLAPPLHYLSEATMCTTQILSRLPYSNINTASPPLWFVIAFYLLLFLAAGNVKKGKPVARSVLIAIIIWILAFIILLPFHPDHRNATARVHVLSVGHGCAAVCELPDGKTVCYDAGSMSNFNIGEYAIIPFLRSRGINRIDAVFISHPNLDHYNALLDLCQNIDVTAVYTTEYFPSDSGSACEFLINSLQELNIPLITVRPGIFSFPDAPDPPDSYQIEILWPLAPEITGNLDANDSSLVLRISDTSGSIFLCGDIGIYPQQKLIELIPPDRLAADIFLLPHHGSASSILPQFVAALDPQLCLSSNDSTQQRSLDTLHRKFPEYPILSTSSHGAISVSLTSHGCQTDTFHKLKIPE